MVVTSFIGDVHPLYAPTSLLIVLLEKHKFIYSSENISCPIIILYLWFPRESYKWKFHVIIFVASNSGSTISTLLWCFIWNSPPRIFQVNGAFCFSRRFCACLPNITEELDLESNNIFIEWNLDLKSNTGV